MPVEMTNPAQWESLQLISARLEFECLDRLTVGPIPPATLGDQILYNLFFLNYGQNASLCEKAQCCLHRDSGCPLRNVFADNHGPLQPFVFRVLERKEIYMPGERIRMFIFLIFAAEAELDSMRDFRMFLKAAKKMEETGVGKTVEWMQGLVRLMAVTVPKANLAIPETQAKLKSIKQIEEERREKAKLPHQRNVKGNLYTPEEGWTGREIIGISFFCPDDFSFEKVPPPHAVTLDFVTPMRLRRDGEILWQPTFVDVIEFLVKRLNCLLDLALLPDQQKFDEAKYLQLARSMQCISDFHPFEHESYGDTVAGAYGQMMVIGDIDPFRPLLTMGALVNIGDGCEMGHGQFYHSSSFPDSSTSRLLFY